MKRFVVIFLSAWLISHQAFAVCTLDPSNVGTNITLSGGNLTWSSTNSGAVSGRGTTGYLAGSGTTNASLFLYFEMTVNVQGSSALGAEVGLMNDLESLSNFVGQTGNSVSQEASTGEVFYIDTVFATYTAAPATAVISVAVDFFHQKEWWRVNGGDWNGDIIANQNPATNTGGLTTAFVFNNGGYFTVYPAFGSRQSGPGGTFNLAGPFAYSVPSGFGSWCPSVSVGTGFFRVTP